MVQITVNTNLITAPAAAIYPQVSALSAGGSAVVYLYDGRGDGAGTVSLTLGGVSQTATHQWGGHYKATVSGTGALVWSVDNTSASGRVVANAASLSAFSTDPAISPAWGYVGDTFTVTDAAGTGASTEMLVNQALITKAASYVATAAGSVSVIGKVNDGINHHNVKSAVAYVLSKPSNLSANFGADTPTGAGALDTNLVTDGPVAQGTYTGAWGEFSVDANGVMTPSAALTAGSYTVGGISVTITASQRTVASAAELTTAITALLAGGTIRVRYAHYGEYNLSTTASTATGAITVSAADANYLPVFSRLTTGSGAGASGSITFDGMDVFSSYDDPAFNNTGSSWNGGGSEVGQVVSSSTVNLTFQNGKIRSDYPNAKTEISDVPWRVYKQTQQVYNKFKIFRAVEGDSAANDTLAFTGNTIEATYGGPWVQGTTISCTNNDIQNIWGDAFNVYAPSNGVTIQSNKVFGMVGDYIHPDFVQVYSKGTTSAVDNLTINYNVICLGSAAENIYHSEDAIRQQKQQGIFCQTLTACTGWEIKGNIISAYAQPITLPTLSSSTVQGNTIINLFQSGANLRAADPTISVSSATSCTITNNGALVDITTDGGGNTVYANINDLVTVLDDQDATSYTGAYQGPSFEMSAMTSLSVFLDAARLLANGTADYDYSGAYSGMDSGALGTTLANGPADFSSFPYVAGTLPARDNADPRDNYITFTDDATTPTFTARSGTNRQVIVTIVQEGDHTSDPSVTWGGNSLTSLAKTQGGNNNLAITTLYINEASFPASATGAIAISWSGASPATTNISVVCLHGRAQAAPVLTAGTTGSATSLSASYTPSGTSGEVVGVFGLSNSTAFTQTSDFRQLVQTSAGSSKMGIFWRKASDGVAADLTGTFASSVTASHIVYSANV